VYSQIGLVGPYLQLYNQLTALENYAFFARIRGLAVDSSHLKRLMDRFGLRGRELDELRTFSSGMLQRMKYVIAVMHQPECLILDEPTRGIDVGAKYEIYTIMNQLADEGKSVVVISSEMPELLGMCDRIYVVGEGEIVGELSRAEASQESIMKCIMRHKKEEVR
jgi:ABC-type sugar transport system ATPase subunit